MSTSFALIGCGKIAVRHANLLGNNEINGASLVAVCDLEEIRAKKIADEFNVSSYTDLHVMMESEEPDVVVLLTPSGSHYKQALDLSNYDCNLIIEKPITLRLDEADEIINCYTKKNKELFVIKQNRFNRPIRKLKEAIENERFGKLTLGTIRVRWCRDQNYYNQDSWRGTWKHDGGVLTNQAIHHLDLLRWIMGDVKSVFAKSSTNMLNIEAEDTAIAIVKFKNDALGIIETTIATRPRDLEGSISVLGEKGSVEVGGFAANQLLTWDFSDGCKEDIEVKEKFSCNPDDRFGYGHRKFYEHVIDVLSNKKENLANAKEARKSLELVHALYESIETGTEVRLGSNYSNSKLGL